jgi:hypothetical protein
MAKSDMLKRMNNDLLREEKRHPERSASDE